MASLLVSPPELRDAYSVTPKHTTSAEVKDHSSSRRGRTENGADTYLSAGNPCLDFFFHVVPSSSKKDIEKRLVAAWDHDPLTTLKLICNLRGVRGTGKSDKEGFYTAALWLHGCHPKTIACNLDSLSKFGYFKDFPEILYRILEGQDIRETQKSEWNERKRGIQRLSRGNRRAPFSNRGRGSGDVGSKSRKKEKEADGDEGAEDSERSEKEPSGERKSEFGSQGQEDRIGDASIH